MRWKIKPSFMTFIGFGFLVRLLFQASIFSIYEVETNTAKLSNYSITLQKYLNMSDLYQFRLQLIIFAVLMVIGPLFITIFASSDIISERTNQMIVFSIMVFATGLLWTVYQLYSKVENEGRELAILHYSQEEINFSGGVMDQSGNIILGISLILLSMLLIYQPDRIELTSSYSPFVFLVTSQLSQFILFYYSGDLIPRPLTDNFIQILGLGFYYLFIVKQQYYPDGDRILDGKRIYWIAMMVGLIFIGIFTSLDFSTSNDFQFTGFLGFSFGLSILSIYYYLVMRPIYHALNANNSELYPVAINPSTNQDQIE